MPVIDYINGATRRIYLAAAAAVDGEIAFHPVDDLYLEYRAIRRTVETVRLYSPLLKAAGNVPKGAGKFTPRYTVLLGGAKVVIPNGVARIRVTGELLTDDLTDQFDTTLVTGAVLILYQPSEAEVIEVNVGTLPYVPVNLTGTGTLAAQPASVEGTDYMAPEHLATGTLQAGSASVSGNGANYLNGSGEVTARVSTVTGTGTLKPLVIVHGSGYLQAALATAEGSAQLGITFSAAWQARASQTYGGLYQPIYGTGVLTNPASTLAGNLQITKTITPVWQAGTVQISADIQKTSKATGTMTAAASTISLTWLSEAASNLQAQPASITATVTVQQAAAGFEVFSSLDEFNNYIVSGGTAQVYHTGTGVLTASSSAVAGTGYVEEPGAVNTTITAQGELTATAAQVTGGGQVFVLNQTNRGYLQAQPATVTATIHIMDFSDPDDGSHEVKPTEEWIVVLPVDEYIEVAA